MTEPTNGNGQPGTAITPRAQIISMVERYADSIVKLAPRGMTSDYYVEELRLYLSQPDKDGKPSKLLECEPVSIARGILRVAQTGLSLGVSCDLLPFAKACQFNPRYNGLVELALQSGVRAINADVVFDDDLVFNFQKGTDFYLRHQRGPRKGKVTFYYAVAELKPGSYVFEILSREEVDKFKARYSKQWAKTPLEEIPWYGKKTAIRQLSKFLPKNPRFAAALLFEREAEAEIPDGEFQVMEEKAMDHAINDSRPDLMQDEKPGDGSCSDAQRERLLDLVEHPKVAKEDRARVEAKLKRGMAWDVAKFWIEELERVIGDEVPSEAAAL